MAIGLGRFLKRRPFVPGEDPLPQTSGGGGLPVDTRNVGRKKKVTIAGRRENRPTEPPAPRRRPAPATAASPPNPPARPATATADAGSATPGPKGDKLTTKAPTAVAAVPNPPARPVKAASVTGPKGNTATVVDVPNPPPRPDRSNRTAPGPKSGTGGYPGPKSGTSASTGRAHIASPGGAPTADNAPSPRERPTDVATMGGIRVPSPRVRPPRTRGTEIIVKANTMPVRPAVVAKPVAIGARPNPQGRPQPSPQPRPQPKPAAPAARPVDRDISGGATVVDRNRRTPQYRQGGEPPLSRRQLDALYDEYYRTGTTSARKAEIDAMIRARARRVERID